MSYAIERGVGAAGNEAPLGHLRLAAQHHTRSGKATKIASILAKNHEQLQTELKF